MRSITENSVTLSPDVLTEDELAERERVTPRTVKRWRALRTGPKHYYAGRFVRYRLEEVVAWEKRETEKAAS